MRGELIRWIIMEWETYLQAAQEAARLAGDMLQAHRASEHSISYKGVVDLVTESDRQSQAMIVDHLSERFPDHDFLAEEDLSEMRGSEFCWIIDPLDGTTNFAHGFPVFSVSIALQRLGETGVGVVFDPTRGEMFTALRGSGAELNGRRISVSSTAELDRSLLATGFPYDIRESRENNLDHFVDFAVRAQAVRRCGSAALDLCYVACGRFDGFWELKLASWDVAAGLLMVAEAGGRVTDFQGGPPDSSGRETVASNGLIHDTLIQVLQLRRAEALPGKSP
jgi:myo-inositol-1(or 4)-monophosphatase